MFVTEIFLCNKTKSDPALVLAIGYHLALLGHFRYVAQDYFHDRQPTLCPSTPWRHKRGPSQKSAGLSGPCVSGQHRNSPNQLVGGCVGPPKKNRNISREASGPC